MDRRSWLWRRKSSEKSPGETESSGGSISSHSERFSDDQVYSNHSSHSPEITSKAEPQQEELSDGVKTLSEKLSAALLNISAKEELVKQHAKVAEEAVSGWEKAESEVLALRQHVEVLNLRNSTLEDRVGHLDGALKECLRQLRQTREEQEQKVHEAIEKKTSEWQITKSELDKELADLHSQLQVAKTEASLTSIDSDLHTKLKIAEKENSDLKLELSSMAEELEIRLIERELSNQAAEQASKQHLDSIKKAAKLEAECRRLKSALRKASATNDHRSFTDSQSDVWERLSIVESDIVKETNEFERNRMSPSVEINLMDDFLEMERLVALPETESDPSLGAASMKTHNGGGMHLKSELQAVIKQKSEVEEMLKKVETEKMLLEIMLNEREGELSTSRNQLESAELKLVEMERLLSTANNAREVAVQELESMKTTVKALNGRVERGDMELVEVQSQLDKACTARREAEEGIAAAIAKKLEAESQCKAVEAELETLLLKLDSLEREVQKERNLSGEMVTKCQELEGEISRLQHEIQHPKAANRDTELRIKQDMELAMAGSKFAECQKTIASLSRQLKTLAALDDFLIGSEDSIEVSTDGIIYPKDGAKSWKPPSTVVVS